MAAKVKVSAAVKEGQAAGAWLVERSAHVLLEAYSNRATNEKRPSDATQKLEAIMGSLRKALGPLVNDSAVAEALRKLDGAIWDCAVEHEDRAWHAAWSAAMGLRGGTANR